MTGDALDELDAELEGAVAVPPPRDAREESIAAELELFAPVTVGELTKRGEPVEPLFRRRTAQESAPGELLLPAGEVCLIAGAGNVGKTTFLAALVASVATGRPVLGQLHPERAGRVLVVVVEEKRALLLAKLDDAAARLDIPHEEARRLIAERVTVRCGGGRLSLLEEVTATETVGAGLTVRRVVGEPTPFAEAMRRLLDAPAPADAPPWRLVVLDPLSRLYTGNENDNGAAARFVNACETLRDTRHRPAVLIAHHVAKGTGGARGASAFVDNSRAALRLSPTDPDRLEEAPDNLVADYRTRHRGVLVEVAKSNYGRTLYNGAPPLRLRIAEEHGRVAMRAETDAELDTRTRAENAIAAATSSSARGAEKGASKPLADGAVAGLLASAKAKAPNGRAR